MSDNQAEPQRLDLIAGSIGIAVLDETGFSEKRMLTALVSVLGSFGEDVNSTNPLQRRSATFAAWAGEGREKLLCQFDCGSGRQIFAHIPFGLFDSLFTRFFGGEGLALALLDKPTGAQSRFADRLAKSLGSIFSEAWPQSAGLRLEAASASFERDEEAAQNALTGLIVLDTSFAGHSISFAIPADMLSAMRSRKPVPMAVPHPRADQRKGRLIERASQVPISVGSSLMLPEMPASRLLSLAVGDLLPLSWPKSLPLTVGGRRFAEGSLGEANGCAAIRIEKIEKGQLP